MHTTGQYKVNWIPGTSAKVSILQMFTQNGSHFAKTHHVKIPRRRHQKQQKHDPPQLQKRSLRPLRSSCGTVWVSRYIAITMRNHEPTNCEQQTSVKLLEHLNEARSSQKSIIDPWSSLPRVSRSLTCQRHMTPLTALAVASSIPCQISSRSRTLQSVMGRLNTVKSWKPLPLSTCTYSSQCPRHAYGEASQRKTKVDIEQLCKSTKL